MTCSRSVGSNLRSADPPGFANASPDMAKGRKRAQIAAPRSVVRMRNVFSALARPAGAAAQAQKRGSPGWRRGGGGGRGTGRGRLSMEFGGRDGSRGASPAAAAGKSG